MNRTEVLVRGAARDFDDIYEGTKLEVIARREELMLLLERKFSLSEWTRNPDSNNTWTGSSRTVRTTCDLLVREDDGVVMLSIANADMDEVVSFSEELGLGIFD
ncbi:MAG: hypothetical protein JKP90_01270 [Desulfofustis sp. PB-SRB1]|jgi:hypothetical protein|nr:hypothetical protein [Desulfofustis sp. PB-SRB1]